MTTPEEVFEAIDGLKNNVVQELKTLHNNIDLLELEQELLDKYLTKIMDNEDPEMLVNFIQQYLEYRDTMSVKDAVENTVDTLDIDEDEDETKD